MLMVVALMKPNYRRCLSCRKVALKQEFWRVVRVPSLQEHTPPVVVLDRGMGRSAYLCPQAPCLKQAQKKDRLGRALKVAVPDQLYQTLWERLPNDQAVRQPEAQLKYDSETRSTSLKTVDSSATGTM